MPVAMSRESSIKTLSKLPVREVKQRMQQAVDELQQAETNVVLLFFVITQRRLYREFGYASIKSYSREELGWSENRICQFIRLADDLSRLPKLRRAVFNDEIGWTKAKEVTKVASPENEKEWLMEAKRSGKRQLIAKIKQARQQTRAARRRDPRQTTLATLGLRGPKVASSVIEPCLGTDTGSDGGGRETTMPEDRGVVTVTLRFTPKQLAQYDAMMEQMYKSRRVPAGMSREDLHLMAISCLLDPVPPTPPTSPATPPVSHVIPQKQNTKSGGHSADKNVARSAGSIGSQEPDSSTGANDNADRSAIKTLPRGTGATNCRIVIHYCEGSDTATIQTRQGAQTLSRAELEAAKCDAILVKPGVRNRSVIPPSVRREVLMRDRFRCQAPGCGNDRFLEIHHRVPRKNGGSNRQENLITLCSRCHRFWHERRLDL